MIVDAGGAALFVPAALRFRRERAGHGTLFWHVCAWAYGLWPHVGGFACSPPWGVGLLTFSGVVGVRTYA